MNADDIRAAGRLRTHPTQPARLMNADDTLRLDRRHLCRPDSSFCHAATPWPAASAQGARLSLSDGRKLIDGMSSWRAATRGHSHPAERGRQPAVPSQRAPIRGHNHPRLNRALTAQSERMAHVMFGGLTRESDSPGL